MTGKYSDYPVPHDFLSDGCTVPKLLRKLYAPYSKACRWHDWARRHLVHYGLLTVKDADWKFRTYMLELGAPAWLASVTWVAVKLTRKKYSETRPVPDEWEKYINMGSSVNTEGNMQ